jgi:enoyl-CoA hydratase/carnithine racemase
MVVAELHGAIENARRDEKVRCVIVTGAGEKAFVAGADIGEFEGRSPVDQWRVMKAPAIFDAVERLPKPVIAAINGYCLGGGMELALACDLRIASSSAKFGQPEVNLGIIPGGGGTQRLARVLGKQRAMELVLTGRRMDAAEAARYGLVNEVAPEGEWLKRAMDLAQRIAKRPPIAVRLAKQAVIAADESGLSEGLEHERRLYELAMATEDRIEGMGAFLEKRKPDFKGR